MVHAGIVEAANLQENSPVTRDKDLLDLIDPSKPEAADFQKNYPTLRILEPPGFLREIASQR
jgi:hypothetical protein